MGCKGRAKKSHKMVITSRAPEPHEVGSDEHPHEFASARTTKSVRLSRRELVMLRSSDLHHILVDRRIVHQSPGLQILSRIRPDPSLPRSRPADEAAGKVLCAGEKMLFDHAEKTFVYHLDVEQLEPLLEAAQVLEVEPLVYLIRKRISFAKQYSRAILQAVLGLVDPSSD